ncbi:unnamed protein product [Trichogramma brassicae]|uniref:Uncharacterized protein n=1 Tax=Trichogramma brassicae TaxID=86971 RepID=A0A6H5J537_9HYME|nr:unnamed protein product [Trichogramma brassicae]
MLSRFSCLRCVLTNASKFVTTRKSFPVSNLLLHTTNVNWNGIEPPLLPLNPPTRPKVAVYMLRNFKFKTKTIGCIPTAGVLIALPGVRIAIGEEEFQNQCKTARFNSRAIATYFGAYYEDQDVESIAHDTRYKVWSTPGATHRDASPDEVREGVHELIEQMSTSFAFQYRAVFSKYRYLTQDIKDVAILCCARFFETHPHEFDLKKLLLIIVNKK